MTLAELQQLIFAQFGAKDGRRGATAPSCGSWKRSGSSAAALRGGHTQEELAAEFADVLAWLATLANIAGVDLDAAVAAKYAAGCPGCGHTPCDCGAAEKP